MKRIFISYSHEDREWVVNWLLPRLEGAGLQVLVDYRDFKIGQPSLINMEKAVKECQKTLLVLTPNWVKSEWTGFENLLLQTKDPIGKKESIIPLMLEKCELPDRLSIFTYADFTNKNNWESELARILGQMEIDYSPEETTESDYVKPKSDSIFLSKMPTTGKDLFGRKKELEIFNQAWDDPIIQVVTLVAWGGVGKTALVNHWLNLLKRKNYCGAQRVYGWSFYSQGAEEGKQASADEFMQTTLEWFGDQDPTAGSNVEKARRLANLIRKEPTLLILDGMEPLQYPPGELHGFDGLLKDQGLKTLLKELAAAQPGLCVITTREPVTDLTDKVDHSVREILLEHLSGEAGTKLMKNLGVTGAEKEIVQAVQEYGGHALALNLLGNYLHTVHQGDIRKRDKIPALTMDRKKGRHARRVMAAYERWLGDSAELNILRIMGLFDRPVEKEAVEALKGESAIPGITQQLQELSAEDWQWALSNLRTANLLSKADPQKPGILDCHPLVREHFGEKLREENLKGWKEAHTRLYHYYKNLPKKKLPDTLAEMEPLLAAVAHGCAAGLHQEALVDVYWQRITRGNEAYTVHKLGAFGADLAALSHFFQVPWSQPAAGLTEEDKALVLSWAGFGLRAVGRLQEALQPMKAGLEMRIKQKVWVSASKNAGNLSELVLALGRVEEAVYYARQAVTHADKSKNWEMQMIMRTTLANALHQGGEVEEAEKWFREAEAMQKKRQPEFHYLYSLRGFQFCDLLLGQGRHQEVRERAENTVIIAKRNGWLLAIALDTLSLGRAWLMQTLAENTGDFSKTEDYLHQAVAGLRTSGDQDFLAFALIKRAEGYRLQQKFKEAQEDLKEALELAQLGSMKLFIADYHLEAGKLCEAQGKHEDAQKHFTTAKNMMEEMGYKRKLQITIDKLQTNSNPKITNNK